MRNVGLSLTYKSGPRCGGSTSVGVLSAFAVNELGGGVGGRKEVRKRWGLVGAHPVSNQVVIKAEDRKDRIVLALLMLLLRLPVAFATNFDCTTGPSTKARAQIALSKASYWTFSTTPYG